MLPVIYDTPIEILKLPDTVGSPLQGTLNPVFSAYCGEKEVYHARFWESVQSGSRVDRLVELPLHRNADAGFFARFRGHIYSIEQAQFSYDDDGLPVTVLSLMRAEGNYDVAGV